MRVLATAASAFCAGIFLSQYLLKESWLLPLALIGLLVGVSSFLAKKAGGLRLRLLAFGFSAALAWNWCYTTLIVQPAEALSGTERTAVSMTMLDEPAATDYGAKVTVSLQGLDLRGGKAVYYGDASLLEYLPGTVITDDVEFSSAAKIRDDELTTFTSKGVYLFAYSRGEPTYDITDTGSIRWLPQRMAIAMRQTIGQIYSGDAAGVLSGILTGEQSGLSAEAESNLSEIGIYHIMAVSGMHCSYLLGFVAFFTKWHRRRLTAAIAVPCLLFYMLLVGCTPSVVRACVMTLFMLAAPLLGREGDPPTSLSAALALILLQNPFAAASISLQLSFGAMAGIAFVRPNLSRLLLKRGKRHGKISRFLAGHLAASLGATVFTAPLCAYYFNSFCLIAPLSNILCLWAASYIFMVGLVSVGVGFFCLPLGMLIGLVPKALVGYLLEMADALAAVPYHALYFSNPYLQYWLIFAYFLIAVCLLTRDGGRRKYLTATGALGLSLAYTVWLGSAGYSYGTMQARVLDVGQGACLMLSSGGDFALVDCGSSNSWYSAGDIAADALLSAGCGKLDYLILTHYDADHISGVVDLLNRLPVEHLVAPDGGDDSDLRTEVLSAAEEAGTELCLTTELTELTLGEAKLTVYPPVGDGEDNERGLTMLCSAGDFDILATGDMNSATERILLDRYTLPDIEVLIVGHHGSKYSTSEELLESLRPEVAVVSVGSNSYGHPAEEVLRRLDDSGAEVYRTDLQGTIELTVN